MKLNIFINIFQTIIQANFIINCLNWKLTFITILHAVNRGYCFRRSLLKQNIVRLPILQGFVSYILSSLGGTLIASILLGQTPLWLVNDNTLPIYFVVYIILFYIDQHGYIVKLFNKGGLVTEIFFDIVDATSRSNTMTSRINSIKDKTSFSNSIILTIICGTISGCGGGILEKTFNLSHLEWKYSTPSALNGKDSYSLIVSLFSTLLYILLAYTPSKENIGFFNHILKIRKSMIGSFSRSEAVTIVWLNLISMNIWHSLKVKNISFHPNKKSIKTEIKKKE